MELILASAQSDEDTLFNYFQYSHDYLLETLLRQYVSLQVTDQLLFLFGFKFASRAFVHVEHMLLNLILPLALKITQITLMHLNLARILMRKQMLSKVILVISYVRAVLTLM